MQGKHSPSKRYGDNPVEKVEEQISTPKNPEALAREQRQAAAEKLLQWIDQKLAADFGPALQHYLDHLYHDHHFLDLGDLGVAGIESLRLPLDDVYVKRKIYQPEGNHAKARIEDLRNPYPWYWSPSEQLFCQSNAVILLGDPGTGKTLFLKRLLLQAVSGHGEESTSAAGCFPVLISLADYSRSLLESGSTLEEFIERYIKNAAGQPLLSVVFQEALRRGWAFILLDGLDEVLDPELRLRVADQVKIFFGTHIQNTQNRMVMTSRVTGYNEVRPGMEGFTETMLMNLTESEEDSSLFSFRFTLPEALERQRSSPGGFLFYPDEYFLTNLWRHPQSDHFSANPLLLALLVLIEYRDGKLLGSQAELFRRYLEIILARASRSAKLRAACPHPGQDELLEILGSLALRLHQAQPEGSLVARAELQRVLVEIFTQQGHSNPDQAALSFLIYACDEIALLCQHAPDGYGFNPPILQDYLAGVYIARLSAGDSLSLADSIHALAGKPDWQEACFFSLCDTAHVSGKRKTGEVFDRLLEQWNSEDIVILAGRVNADLPGCLEETAFSKVQAGLVQVFAGQSPARVRAQAGDVLAELGDARPEVMTSEEMAFLPIPAGAFLFGSRDEDPEAAYGDIPQRRINVAYDYWIAKYPVSNAQFNQFVLSGGYSTDRFWPEAKARGLWTSQGYQQRQRPASHSYQASLPNRPVIGISWYEALAFCRWLGEELIHLETPLGKAAAAGSLEVNLPSEVEWEKAARGVDGRKYPWGNTFDPDKANTAEMKIGTSSVLGCFPEGTSPYGVQEMIGNVWEWTCSPWTETFEVKKESRADPQTDELRVTRGGSFDYTAAACSTRFFSTASLCNENLGFRVVIRPTTK